MWRFGLRGRMAASYVLVTATAVLLVETVLVLAYLAPRASGDDLMSIVREQASADAKVLSLAVSGDGANRSERDLLAGADVRGTGLDGRGPLRRAGQWGPDAPPAPELPAPTSPSSSSAPVIPAAAPGGPAEVLTDAYGEIVRSTAPGRYAAGGRLGVALPSGGDGGGVRDASGGGATWWLSPVLLRAGEGAPPRTVGYVYVEAPPGWLPPPVPGEWLAPLLAPGGVVLAVVVPVGLVFGMLATRGLTRRVRRLADVTAAVAAGDFRPRVPVRGADEVATLERSFNAMTDRLGRAVEAAGLAARAEARQAERGRIARELHDSISQDLFSLSLLAGGMRRAAPEALRARAESMEQVSARAMREMQALLLELRPVALEDAGLLPAVEEVCAAYETRLGVRVIRELAEVALSPQAEHAVLRVVQEAVGNAVRHAAPGEVAVRLSRRDGAAGRPGEVVLEVADDGHGFDPGEARARHGMGLALMRERVTELGGGFEVRGGPGGGTTVVAVLPERAP
uniref:HAMP domain-containing sensor histidine kinase n=1 Tax=Nonomuraea pusilla TaxID=46177 RepID=UPI0006E29B3C|nr:ATP-binding protein [Nonomuraea pusilla]